MKRSKLTILFAFTLSWNGCIARASDSPLTEPIVLTQLPVERAVLAVGSADGMLPADFGNGARIVIVEPGGKARILSKGFAGATEPHVSFDAKHIVFAGKKTQSDSWNIYETDVDGSDIRQITNGLGDCRQPIYLSTLYTIISTEPWYQIAFTSTEAGELNERGSRPATHVYTCRLDGTEVRRLTFNLSSDRDPFLMEDGRLVYATWQRSTLLRGPVGRVSLFTVNADGTDMSVFAADEGRRVKLMPSTTTNGRVVFVENDKVPWDGAGRLGSVELRRPLHSYRPIPTEDDSYFHSPSPLPDGRILVSRRSIASDHAVVALDPETGATEPVFDDPDYHDIQAKLLRPRPEPDGRSSVVTEKDPHGELYALDVTISDLKQKDWMDPTVSRLRVLEGIARDSNDADQKCQKGMPSLAQKRLLGEIPIERDGSFYVKVPADTPIQLQVLDENGMALRTCSWIWAKNHEPRGCIGCHEDPELAPENRFIEAVKKPPVQLTLPSEKRRTVDFRRDVMPIINAKCATSGCHEVGGFKPLLSESETEDASCYSRAYRNLLSVIKGYIDPGQARTSPLVWFLFGKNTSRPWDSTASDVEVRPMPPPGSEALTEQELRTFVEWIDLGALWDAVPEQGNDEGTGEAR